MAEEPKGAEKASAKQSLSAKLKEMASKGAAASPAAPKAPEAKPAETNPAAESAPAPAAAEPVRRSSLAAKLRAMAVGDAPPADVKAEPAKPATLPPQAAAPAKPAAAPAPAPAPPPAVAPAAPAKPAPPAPMSRSEAARAAPPPAPDASAAPPEGFALVRRSSMADRLRAEAASRAASPGAPAAPAPAPAPVPAARQVAPVAAAAPPPAAPPAPTEATYVDDAISSRLPVSIRRILRRATAQEKLEPILTRLKSLRGPELERQKGLFDGFVENMTAVLRNRFLQEDYQKSIFIDETGDLSLRVGDGEVKVQASCWELFFLSRQRRPLGQNRLVGVQSFLGDVLKFTVADTPVCKMKIETPVEFEPKENAYYFEAQLDLGGWCDMRFGGASVFSDGRVLAVTLEPRVVRGKDIPAPKGMDPKQFTSMLSKMRRRE